MKRGFAAAAMVAIIVLAGTVARGDSGVGVLNNPPTFLDISVGDYQDYIVININVSDTNGWRDVFYVNLEILDGDGNVVENATYSQHDTNTTYDVLNDLFTENSGSSLSQELCDVQRYSSLGTGVESYFFYENTTLYIRFGFSQFQGKTLRVTGVDIQHATCFYEGPFSSTYRPEPFVKEKDLVILVSVSILMAIGGSLIFAYRRGLSNRMARKIEAIERKHAEEEEGEE